MYFSITYTFKPQSRNLGYVPYYERLIKTYNPTEAHVISGLFECYVTPCAHIIIGKVSDRVTSTPLETVIPVFLLNQIRQLCIFVQSMLECNEIHYPEVHESIFVLSFILSFDGLLTEESMLKFGKFVKLLSN